MKKKVLTLISFAICLTTFLFTSSKVYSNLHEREKEHAYFSDALDVDVSAVNTVQWGEPELEPGSRTLSPGEGEIIARAVGRALRRLSFAQSIGDPDILHDSFSGPALNRARKSAQDAADYGGRIAFLTQRAIPIFFHQDGSVLQIKLNLLVARFFTDPERPGQSSLRNETAVVTLLNEATGWRIYSYQLTDSAPVLRQRKDVTLPLLRGVNYYPAQSPWRKFWEDFDPEIVSDDFWLIQSLRANSVRFFLDYQTFIDPETRDDAIENLTDFLAIAERNGIMLIPTLFDLKQDYRAGYWEQDARYLATVLPVLGASSAVRLIDIKNEPDLDYDIHGKNLVDGWLRTMILISSTSHPDLPITIGWSNAQSAENLIREVDVVTYHAYEDMDEQPYVFAELKSKAGGKPVLITEIGESSFNLGIGFPANRKQQAHRLGKRLAALSVADGIFVWTLHDFPDVDPNAVGNSIWVRRLQSQFGLFDQDGIAKPVAQTVTRAFGNLVQAYPTE